MAIEDDNNTVSRRIYNGKTVPRFEDPFSAVISIRNVKHIAEQICSGVLVTRTKALTASSCVLPDQKYFVGYGSIFADEHTMVLVERVKYMPYQDAALLFFVSEVLLPASNDFILFGKDRWYTENFIKAVQNKTFLLGYGDYEGDLPAPKPILTNQLRQEDYAFTINMDHCNEKKYPGAGIGPPGLKIDFRYICSASKPEPINANDVSKWTTACTADRGGPVFIKMDDGKIKLAGIHSTGPRECGQGAFVESALMINSLNLIDLNEK